MRIGAEVERRRGRWGGGQERDEGWSKGTFSFSAPPLVLLRRGELLRRRPTQRHSGMSAQNGTFHPLEHRKLCLDAHLLCCGNGSEDGPADRNLPFIFGGVHDMPLIFGGRLGTLIFGTAPCESGAEKKQLRRKEANFKTTHQIRWKARYVVADLRRSGRAYTHEGRDIGHRDR